MTELVLPQHTNSLGGVFGGVIMSWIDVAGAIAAQRHSGRVCVTASVDELHFLRSVKKGYIVNISSQVTCVHRTSCEVMVRVKAENPIMRECFHTVKAFLTFVAVDSDGRPVEMPKLKVESKKEKELEAEAKIRREHRKKLKKLLMDENDHSESSDES